MLCITARGKLKFSSWPWQPTIQLCCYNSYMNWIYWICTKKNQYLRSAAVSEGSRHLHQSHTLLHSHLPPPVYISQERWSEGLTEEEREEINERPDVDVEKKEKNERVAKREMMIQQEEQMGGREKDKAGSQSITVFSTISTISVCCRPAIMLIPFITMPALWLVKEAGLSLGSTIG